jgi:hypothetical protein
VKKQIPQRGRETPDYDARLFETLFCMIGVAVVLGSFFSLFLHLVLCVCPLLARVFLDSSSKFSQATIQTKPRSSNIVQQQTLMSILILCSIPFDKVLKGVLGVFLVCSWCVLGGGSKHSHTTIQNQGLELE